MRQSYVHIRVAKVQKPDNTTCWQGCRVKETPTFHWWESKISRALWKTICNFIFTKLNIQVWESHLAFIQMSRKIYTYKNFTH